MSKIIPVSGFPEWKPGLQVAQERILDVIRTHFRLHGYSPIDTSLVERVESLSAKGGGENEKEIYGLRRLHGLPTDEGSLALRFDLTVPLARYVAQNERELAFPFRRYAIGRVYRGERPQAGRFREFYQCDIDVIGNGTLSLDYDAEAPAIMYEIFSKIGLGDVLIRVNNCKVLRGFLQGFGKDSSLHNSLFSLVDKRDKIGQEELSRIAVEELGLPSDAVESLASFLSTKVPLDAIKETISQLSDNPMYQEGVKELAHVVNKMLELGIPESAIVVDMSIARGLDYYTGTVYETALRNRPEVGSVCSGGRYENLVANFSSRPFPGVGMSIGLTRLVYRLAELKLLKEDEQSFSRVMIANMGSSSAKTASQLAQLLRGAGIACEEYMTEQKLDKQIIFALKKGCTYLLLIGEDELATGSVCVKNLKDRTQKVVPFNDVVQLLV